MVELWLMYWCTNVAFSVSPQILLEMLLKELYPELGVEVIQAWTSSHHIRGSGCGSLMCWMAVFGGVIIFLFRFISETLDSVVLDLGSVMHMFVF